MIAHDDGADLNIVMEIFLAWRKILLWRLLQEWSASMRNRNILINFPRVYHNCPHLKISLHTYHGEAKHSWCPEEFQAGQNVCILSGDLSQSSALIERVVAIWNEWYISQQLCRILNDWLKIDLPWFSGNGSYSVYPTLLSTDGGSE